MCSEVENAHHFSSVDNIKGGLCNNKGDYKQDNYQNAVNKKQNLTNTYRTDSSEGKGEI